MKSLARNRLAVKTFHMMMGFARWLQAMPDRVTPPPFRLLQIGSAFWLSRALYVATRLCLADELDKESKGIDELAERLGLNEEHLYRLMRMLAANGIFHEIAPRVFRNSKTSNYLRSNNPHNVRAMILMHNSEQMIRPWIESLEEAVRRGGIPFKLSHGRDLFAYMDENREFDLLFSSAMDSVEALTGNTYLRDFRWDKFNRLIDVGGSRGQKALAILEFCPDLEAVVFDRPQVIEAARSFWQGKIADTLLSRVRFEAGDMFDAVPPAISDNDLYLFFAVFHGLSDADGRLVLDKLRIAFGDKRPTVLIADAVVAEMSLDAAIASFDMQMLIGTEGRERTLPEWQSLLASGGFELVEVIEVRTFVKFLVARRC